MKIDSKLYCDGLMFSDKSLSQKDKVYIWGFPFYYPFHFPLVIEGIISAIPPPPYLTWVNSPVNGGNSGGPVEHNCTS